MSLPPLTLFPPQTYITKSLDVVQIILSESYCLCDGIPYVEILSTLNYSAFNHCFLPSFGLIPIIAE